MTKSLFGNTLLIIATLLFATHNIVAAIIAGTTESFEEVYRSVGHNLDVLACIALILGFLSLTATFWQEIWQLLNTPLNPNNDQPVEPIDTEQVTAYRSATQPKTAKRER
ncbi:MAG: hypothetical protein ACYC6A_13180 [Armatimonadota bacterium]